MLTATTRYELDKEDWLSYVERKELQIVKDINNEPKKKALFLRCCGILNYGIFKELTPSAELREKGFQALVRFMRLMKGKQNPKRNPIAKTFTFNSRNR